MKRNSILFEFIRENNLQAFVAEIDRCPDSIHLCDKYGEPVMILASISGRTEFVDALVKRGADVDSVGEKNRTALFFAIEKHHFDLARHLIELGANVNKKDSWGDTALHLAVSRSDSGLVAELLSCGANPNEVGRGNNTCLKIAVTASKNIEIVRMLVERGANLETFAGEVFFSALTTAAVDDDLDVVRFLVSQKNDYPTRFKNGTQFSEMLSLSVPDSSGISSVINFLNTMA